MTHTTYIKQITERLQYTVPQFTHIVLKINSWKINN